MSEVQGDSDHVDTGTMPFHCKVSFNNFTRIQLFPVQLDSEAEHSVGWIGKLNRTREDTSVSVNASVDSAIFTGEFGILDIDHNSILLNLPSNSNKSVITVTNNADVELQWQGWDQLLITPILGVNQGIAGHAEYEVRVRSVEGLGDKVIISLANNDRRLDIDVNYEPEEKIPRSRMDKFLGVCTNSLSVLVPLSVLLCLLHNKLNAEID
ncbi:hypothetical protein POM88_024442 [Heracleum sosnowskyi]|uniref:Nuclear pore complex protein GP210 C-terminal Ig-like domain-containing protein n=1 Tax=Heracleum sosnowskyi TaxID=360622 RepID=A0AAD8I4H0_9APIA|nr:hypothetical protein POM88_024442 [Heracleum sosnowskyi]